METAASSPDKAVGLTFSISRNLPGRFHPLSSGPMAWRGLRLTSAFLTCTSLGAAMPRGETEVLEESAPHKSLSWASRDWVRGLCGRIGPQRAPQLGGPHS